MGGDALGPGQITVALVRRVFGQGKPDYFSYPSPSCCSEMGDPGQCLFDGSRRVICVGRDNFWCAPASGIPNAVYLRSRRFGLGNRGVRLKCPSGNDTGAVDLGFPVAAQCKTSQEHRANL